ncbi:thioredoxin family protein [Beijerinckia sp. L45]|uniref:thioredoxin family protein n=1 Tax=Beijerinckia sp. L45 TaxID=1641855 RepID=UPI00131B4ACD|nr:thioredoxin family protein [Beijerinckia sp. L45]
MPNRRVILVLFASAFAMVGTGVRADAPAPIHFDQQAFDAAQKAGKPILVEITAPWCPACKAQAPILGKLRSDPRFRDLQTFTIDFDTEKDLMHKFGAKLQSTLICFKGTTEIGRSIGETQPEWIEAQLEKAI